MTTQSYSSLWRLLLSSRCRLGRTRLLICRTVYSSQIVYPEATNDSLFSTNQFKNNKRKETKYCRKSLEIHYYVAQSKITVTGWLNEHRFTLKINGIVNYRFPSWDTIATEQLWLQNTTQLQGKVTFHSLHWMPNWYILRSEPYSLLPEKNPDIS